MSSIVGIIDKKNNCLNADKIKDMLEILTHGNSNYGTESIPANGCFFGFTHSNQPIYNEDRTLVLYFSGEIYNYKELKSMLSGRGHNFNTNEPAEVVIHLVEEFGKKSLKYLDGLFVFCILNTITQSLFISRDRYGIKPMYYSYSDDCFYFATELKAIINVKSKNTINKEAIELYANLRYVPAPYTIIEGVYKLKAGEYLFFEDGIIKTTNYIKYNDTYESLTDDNVLEIIKDNILTTYNSDYEFGVFLSGGFDSSIISSVLKNKNLKTFSVGYEVQTENDETEIARKIASELNVDNLCQKLKNNELLNILNKAIYYLDEPLYSTASAATLKLSQMSNNFVKGVLTGDGSDEIFYGYKYLREALKQTNIEGNYFNSIGWLKETKYSDLFFKTNLKEKDMMDLLFDGCHTNDYAETFRRVELFKRLPDYHLTRMERLTKACGLEIRVPFLRNNIVEMALGFSSDKLLNDSEPKKFLKEHMKSYLTPTIRETVKKPFTSPTKIWIEDILYNDIKSLFNNKELISLCGLNYITINNLLKNYSGKYSEICEIWGIYMLLKWIEQYKKFIS